MIRRLEPGDREIGEARRDAGDADVDVLLQAALRRVLNREVDPGAADDGECLRRGGDGLDLLQRLLHQFVHARRIDVRLLLLRARGRARHHQAGHGRHQYLRPHDYLHK